MIATIVANEYSRDAGGRGNDSRQPEAIEDILHFHLIARTSAFPKNSGPENPVPVVVAVKPWLKKLPDVKVLPVLMLPAYPDLAASRRWRSPRAP